FLPGARGPPLHRPVPTGRGEPLPVRAEGHGRRPVGVSLEGEVFLARAHVPHLHRPVVTGRAQPLPVRAKGHARDNSCVGPLRVRVSWPVCAFQTFTVWSPLAEASRCPSGLKATPQTRAVCPLRERESRAERASRALTVRSPLA